MTEQVEGLDLAIARALELNEARQEAKKAETIAFDEAVKAKAEELSKEQVTTLEKELKSWKDEKGAVTVLDPKKAGSGGETGDNSAFLHWMKSGDYVAARKSLDEAGDDFEDGTDVDSKKALQEGTGSEGGFLVPDDFVASIIQKRDAVSFPRQMGVRVINTNRDKIDLPAEDTSLAKFTRTAEEAGYTTNDPSLAQNQVTVEKWTKLTKISEELLEDDAAGLEGFYTDAVGRAWAETEAYYVAIGSGSSQHQGIFTGGDTDAITFNTDNGADSDGVLLPDSIWYLYYTLGEGYRSDAAWLMDPLTERAIVSMKHTSSNPNWAFQAADMVSMKDGRVSILGRPSFNQGDVPVQSAGVCFIMFGSPWFYALVERRGLAIKRNPYLYQANGQVGFFSTFRQGGAVTVEESWVGGVGA